MVANERDKMFVPSRGDCWAQLPQGLNSQALVESYKRANDGVCVHLYAMCACVCVYMCLRVYVSRCVCVCVSVCAYFVNTLI